MPVLYWANPGLLTLACTDWPVVKVEREATTPLFPPCRKPPDTLIAVLVILSTASPPVMVHLVRSSVVPLKSSKKSKVVLPSLFDVAVGLPYSSEICLVALLPGMDGILTCSFVRGVLQLYSIQYFSGVVPSLSTKRRSLHWVFME